MASHNRLDGDGEPAAVFLDPNEVAQEIPQDEDVPMESGSEGEEQGDIELVNDSRAYFDLHKESIFAIANHPLFPEELFITGGGDDIAYIWGVFPEENIGENRVIPQEGKLIQKLDGFEDSVIATGFSKVHGELVAAAGLDGRLKIWRNRDIKNDKKSKWKVVGEVREVEEIDWIEWHPKDEEVIAFGAADGSVWIYQVEENDLVIRHALYSHTDRCTAGRWLPTDGSLLNTVSADGSFYAWDPTEGRSLIGLTKEDQRFKVEGGFVSIAINPEGTIAVIGGGNGTCKIVGLPRSAFTPASSTSGPIGKKPTKASAGTGAQTAGQILATLKAGAEFVESIAFSKPPAPLLVTSSVDGTITIFDASRQYTVRKVIEKAHEDAIVKVEFAPSSTRNAESIINAPVVLTSCSTDKTIKRWDARTGAELGVWKGHADGILGFVQTERVVVTAGDDHVSLLFNTIIPPSTTSSWLAPTA